MFGKSKSLEEVQTLQKELDVQGQILKEIAGRKDEFTALLEESKVSHGQMLADLKQLEENEKKVCSDAAENVNLAAGLCHSMEEILDYARASEAQNAKLLEQIHSLNQEMSNLVEENKHFTSPSKYMQELPGSVRSMNEGYVSQLEVMSEVGKKMGVLALNAAIEAGRMGENGKQFVAAAEDVRIQAGLYESLIQKLLDKIKESNEKVDKMEEQIRHLVNLLKENNIATGHCMKDCLEVDRQAEKNLSESKISALEELKAHVVDLKNSQEEIYKTEERNLMQLEDIRSEGDTQVQKITDMEKGIVPVMEKAGSFQTNDKEGD